MSRWFRLYDELLDDPKVQKLHPALFKVLINLWCVASRHDGKFPAHQDMAFSLRMSEDETFRAVSKLAEAGFIDTDPATGEQRPHEWDIRQFRSDLSTDRVRKHRKGQKSANKPPDGGGGSKASGNADETFHETATETEQIQRQNSVPNGTGTVVPHPAADFQKAVFDAGCRLLMAVNHTERQARSMIGRWRKNYTDPEILTVLARAEVEVPSEPIEWITKSLEYRNGAPESDPAAPWKLRDGSPDPLFAALREAHADCAAESTSGHPQDDPGAGLSLQAIGR